MGNFLKILLGLIGIGAVGAAVHSKGGEHKKSEEPKKKGKYNPQPYSVSLKKYGHLKSLKDYPKKLRWYEPKGEYENRTFDKWNGKEWIEIDSVEYDYYMASVDDNTDYEYKRAKSEKGKTVYTLVKQ